MTGMRVSDGLQIFKQLWEDTRCLVGFSGRLEQVEVGLMAAIPTHT